MLEIENTKHHSCFPLKVANQQLLHWHCRHFLKPNLDRKPDLHASFECHPQRSRSEVKKGQHGCVVATGDTNLFPACIDSAPKDHRAKRTLSSLDK